MRPLHVDVPLLLLATAADLRATLRQRGGERGERGNLDNRWRTHLIMHLAEDGLDSVGVKALLTLPAELLVVHLKMNHTWL